MLLRCIDFETTGYPPEAGIVEVGWNDVTYDPETKKAEVKGSWESALCNPLRKVEIAAMAVHHITDEDIQHAPSPSAVLGPLLQGPDYVCAHHTGFERQFVEALFPEFELRWICTLKAAYRLCPSAPNHKNQTIRYFLKTPVNRGDALHTHRAGPDAYVTAHNLAKFLTAVSPDQLVKWESEPPYLPYCPIGAEWRGRPWSEVDTSFLTWMMKTKTMEPDLKFNAKRELDRRYPEHAKRHEEKDTGGFLSNKNA